MYYSEEVIEEVRTKNDIVDVISGYVRLQKKGSSYFGLCPFHNEKSPSFSVSREKQMYYCFGCGAGGNVFTFLMDYENFSFVEALKFLADRAGVVLPEMEYSKEAKARADRKTQLLEINKLAAQYFYVQLKSEQGKTAHAYLTGRQLSEETIKAFGLGYSSKYSDDLFRYLRKRGYTEDLIRQAGLINTDEKNGVYDKFWNRVMFPIMDVNNRVIGFGGRVMGDAKPKYLNSPETEIFDKSRNLYGLNRARTSRKPYFLVCEGYMDVIALHQAGFTNAVASLGTALTTGHAALIKRYVQEVYLTYDSDEAGTRAALRAVPILKEAGITAKVIRMDPYKDPDEFIKNMGSEAFKERIAQAKNSFLFEIDVLKRNYQLEDPEQKTRFYQETAKKLLQFGEPLERDNYIQAVSREQMIKEEELRQLVNRLGMQMGLKAGDSYREDASGRSVISRENENSPGNNTGRLEYGGDPYVGQAVGQNQMPIKKAGRKQEREDGIRRSQRLLLTWLIENPELFDKINGIITADDFVEDLYHQVAAMVFEGHEAGNVNPAGILSRFINDEDQYKEVAALFNASLKESLNNEEQKKAFAETVMKVRKNSLDTASRNAKDIAQLQEIIKQQAALKQLHISLD